VCQFWVCGGVSQESEIDYVYTYSFGVPWSEWSPAGCPLGCVHCQYVGAGYSLYGCGLAH
jgi:hypothetical protein